MLVHSVSWGGVAVVGSKDIMAVSRVWGQSFAGLRRLHSFRSVSFSGTWTHRTFEPIVPQSPICTRHLRFIAHAAALEESPDLHHRRGGRLSRAERYVLVENFVIRHKDAHEGKWPSVNAIVKEIGGSRLIVKDIVEELEKKVHREAAEPYEEEVSAKSQVRSGDEGLAALDIEEDEHQVAPREADAIRSSENLTATKSDVESFMDQAAATDDWSASRSGQSKPRSREIESEPGLWRRLRNLGQQESQQESQTEVDQSEHNSSPILAESPAAGFDIYATDSEDDEDEDEEDFPVETYEEGKDAKQRDSVQNRTKSSSPKSSSESSTVENFGMFIRFLPLAATELDLRSAFQDCGEIVRAQAMVPKGSGLKFTYGFVDFSTPEALSKALRKEKVFIKGSTILTEACSGPRRTDTRPTSVRKSGPEHFKKSETYRTVDRNLDSRPANGTRNLPTSRFKRIEPHTGSENGSRSSTNNGSYLVAVEGLPYPMPISAVEKMLSAHGDIARSELAREDGGTYSAHVEFKTEEAQESALASSRVYLGGRWCRITTGEPILTTVVRLSNVGNASENFIFQRCGKFGRVDSIVHRKEGVVDVYYHPSEKRNMRKILDRLGDVNADFKRWHATLAPRCSLEEMRNSAEIQDWVEVQKDRLLDSLAGAMKLMIIDLEDLRELVDAERIDVSNAGTVRKFDKSSSTKPNNRS